MFQKILVALDQSETSQQVLEKAIDIAKTNQARLMLLHVLAPINEVYPLPIYPGVDGIYTAQHDAVVRAAQDKFSLVEQVGLDHLRSQVSAASVQGIPAEFTQALGAPNTVICDLAKSWGADLIVMGRRGRSGLAELVLGSVSNYVMHHACCSVLVVQAALVTA
jgi:nucleotide-binding universal stress UspA family protein